VWKKVSDRTIAFMQFDIAEHYHRLLTLFEETRPDVVVHFVEQRAAPYSMKSSFQKRYTVNNNTNATNNILAAIVESGLDIHLVHLGTMGVYGYGAAGVKIPEGYLRIKLDTETGETIPPKAIARHSAAPTISLRPRFASRTCTGLARITKEASSRISSRKFWRERSWSSMATAAKLGTTYSSAISVREYIWR
jgi:hypothetical protein